MASCLGSNSNNNDDYPWTDAEIVNFSLSSDSLSTLANVVFTIDQRAGLIYNYDSMAYQTALKYKPIITYTSGAGTANVLNITGGDSIWVASGDSLSIVDSLRIYSPDISDSLTVYVPKTLTFRVYSLDAQTTKTYTMQLNIHQVDPDSMVYSRIDPELSFLKAEETKTVMLNNTFHTYSRINGLIQLHTSSDAINWTQETVSGLPVNVVISGIQSNGNQLFAYTDDGDLYVRHDLTVDEWLLVDKPSSIKIKSILGYLNASPNNPEGLSLIIETEGKNTFAFTKDFIQWDYDSTVSIPDNFPMTDFSTYCYELMYLQRITIIGGISSNGVVQNAVWATDNGRYWAKLTSDGVNVFPPLEGANAIYYNKEFWLMNGQSGGSYNKNIYYSVDGGITWQIKPEKCTLPINYTGRYGASVVMDKDNKYFYIIGGKQAVNLTDIWKGGLNKMEFAH
jgi:hypothetical protein